MSESLRSETTVPAGGWHYRCSVTGWTLQNPTGGDLDAKVSEVLKHNMANRAKGLTLETEEIRTQITVQTIAHLKSIGAHREIIQVPKPSAPEEQSLLGPSGLMRRVAAVVANDSLGAKIITDWFGEGGHPVIHPIAERRSEACFSCPRNSRKARRVTGKIADVVKWAAGFKQKASLHVNRESELGSCTVCGCHLPTKVWVPKNILDADQEHKYPENCWITKERSLPDVKPYDLSRYGYSQGGEEPPAVTDQSGWKAGFFPIEAKSGELWFNPGVLRIDGALWLAIRRMTYPKYKAEIVFLKLDEQMRPVERKALQYRPTFADEHMEDGRMIAIPGNPHRFLLAASNFFISSKQHQALFEVDKDFKVQREIRIEFGGNANAINQQKHTEKNWQFFYVGGTRLHFVHWIRPNHVVCEVEGNKVINTWETPTYPTWPFGPPHGGTPPVRVGDLYWSFFHSNHNFTPSHRRYFMGVYAFDAKPPYTVRYMSKLPFLSGTKSHPVTLWHHLVVFPAGALYDKEKDEWLVTFGVNDCASAWIKIPHSQLMRTVA